MQVSAGIDLPFIKETPYKKRQVIALSLLLGSVVGLCLIPFLPKDKIPPLLYQILLHGLEGGLVGGLCDWFAVWKTYNAIEKDSETVAREIGKWVASDLLNQSTLRAQLRSIIDDPSNQKEIIALIETYFDTKENTKKILDDFWAKIEGPVTDYIVNYNFTSAEIQIITDTAHDRTIVETVKLCVGDTLVRIAEEKEFRNVLERAMEEQNIITKFITNLLNIPELIRGYGEKLKKGESITGSDEQVMDEMVTLASISLDKYFLSWDALPKDRKIVAVNALIFKIKEGFGNMLARFIIEYKNELKARKSLGEYRPVREVFDFIESKIDENVSGFIGDRITTRLQSQDPKDFREKIEWQTRNVLENIRINGTILGFLLGGIIGTVVGMKL